VCRQLQQSLKKNSGGKGSNAKNFTLYHEIEFSYYERTGAFLGLCVREQFQFGPTKFFPLQTLLEMKKMVRGPCGQRRIGFQKQQVLRQAVHGSGFVESVDL